MTYPRPRDLELFHFVQQFAAATHRPDQGVVKNHPTSIAQFNRCLALLGQGADPTVSFFFDMSAPARDPKEDIVAHTRLSALELMLTTWPAEYLAQAIEACPESLRLEDVAFPGLHEAMMQHMDTGQAAGINAKKPFERWWKTTIESATNPQAGLWRSLGCLVAPWVTMKEQDPEALEAANHLLDVLAQRGASFADTSLVDAIMAGLDSYNTDWLNGPRPIFPPMVEAALRRVPAATWTQLPTESQGDLTERAVKAFFRHNQLQPQVQVACREFHMEAVLVAKPSVPKHRF